MAARLSLRDFLIQAKSTLHSALQTSASKPLHLTFAVGNESADLDSLTSTILYAYIRSYTARPQPPYAPLIIPLSNLPRADISLRPELEKLLSHTNISSSHLITLNDLSTPDSSLDKVLAPEQTRWILVDHNNMTGALGSTYRQSVVGVIDHHDDELTVPRDCGDEPRIIEKSGSCASLVTNYLLKAWDSLPSARDQATGERTECDRFLAQMAMASILIDTSNLTVSSKVTPHDTTAVTYLMSKIPDFKQDAFFEEISKAKGNIDNLRLVDILRKDYKEFESGGLKLGVAGVVKPMSFLVEKANEESPSKDIGEAGTCDSFQQVLAAFSKGRGLDIVAVMTTYTPDGGDFSRELLAWGLNQSSQKAMSRFEGFSSQELGLYNPRDKTLKFGDVNVKIWQQTAVQHSRKQVAPLLRKGMSD